MQRIIAGAAKDAKLKVILCGEGADELFCGYPDFTASGEQWKHLRIEFLADLNRTQLQRVDRMAMHFTTEVRVPFLDGRLVKAVLRERRENAFLNKNSGAVEAKTILREALYGVVPDMARLRPKVVLSEGVGLRGNAPKDGLFAKLAGKTIKPAEAMEIRHAFPEWNLTSSEDAYYFREFHRLGYSKAHFMQRRVRANVLHSFIQTGD
uniref:Asparagine synthase n=1 Tax=Candidatus Kentrum eta TaxID=2126337 RepID=A0A450VQC0_9GAMM|nr:MAG: Asparagine synthase [Candidatus Kentron sp. H]VFK06977.1 MAG: Asparagine synthase [Candidatus Kentron sp. H]